MIWTDLKKTLRSKNLSGKFDLAREIYNYQQSLTAEKCARYIKNLKKVIKKNKTFK